MTLVPVDKKSATPQVRYRVVECGDPNMRADPVEICCNAPIVIPFLDEEVGHEAPVMRKGKMEKMRLTCIEIG